VAVGACLALAEAGRVRIGAVAGAALASGLIQIGTNLYNDAADHARGADGPGRIGPPRMTAMGLLKGAEVARAAIAAFGLAALLGVGLIVVGGWPIVALGLVSLVCGFVYSGGPLPISHTPLGEALVVLFFGVAAVAGTYWLAADAFAPATVVAGVAIGLFAAAVLLANNHRDRAEDARAGRRTLAILLGPRATRAVYAALILAPFGLLVPLAQAAQTSRIYFAFLAFPLAAYQAVRFAREPIGRGLNAILAATARTQALYAALLCFGLLWR